MFPLGDIYGLDLGGGDYQRYDTFNNLSEYNNAHMYVGDQTDVAVLKKIGNAAIQNNGGFDVIIDDGGHLMNHQKVSLFNLWRFVKPGGELLAVPNKTQVLIILNRRLLYNRRYRDFVLSQIRGWTAEKNRDFCRSTQKFDRRFTERLSWWAKQTTPLYGKFLYVPRGPRDSFNTILHNACVIRN